MNHRERLQTQFSSPYLVVGLGVTGKSIRRLLLAAGVSEGDIFSFDDKDPSADFSRPEDFALKKIGTMIVSPGVPLSSPWIVNAKARGVTLSSELEIASSFLTDEKMVAVTGSIGKSTCTALLGAGLAAFTTRFFVGGNLGTPLADYVTSVLGGQGRAEWIALELSSYQLENYQNLSPVGSILTYLTPNHMERYSSLQSYYEIKWSLVSRTKGPVIGNKNGGDLFSFAKSKNESLVWIDAVSAAAGGESFSGARLVGSHNADNLSLVLTLAKQLGWPPTCRDGFFSFPGLPHRLESLPEKMGARWINDSKSTTIESALQAIQSTQNLGQRRTLILIGGKDKNLPWEDLQVASALGREFIFFGQVGASAQVRSGLSGKVFPSLGAALDHLEKIVAPEDLVLLSPGGTSLDEFKSFEERGDFFKSRIAKLESTPGR